MSEAEQIVDTFLAMWARPGGFADAIRRYFTDATVYENIGMSKTTGIAEGVALAEQFTGETPGAVIKVETLRSAANGSVVMNERIDSIVDGDGNVQMALAVMGVFEVEGGKITGWRDYFDTAGFFAKMAADSAAG